MRCPECGRLMMTSYISDSKPQTNVYQCSTTGVPMFGVNKKGHSKQVGSTTDHTDRYFVQSGLIGPLLRVTPVDLGTDKRKTSEGKSETFHHWGFEFVKVV